MNSQMYAPNQMMAFQSHEQASAPVLMYGLHAAGKTTVLHVMKYNEIVAPTPTIGGKFETVIVSDIETSAWQHGGRCVVRPSWQDYYQTAKAVIFVVDSNVRTRIDAACWELHRLTKEDGLKHKSILIFTNKQDLPNAMTLDELRDKLALAQFDGNTKWHLQGVCAVQNEGIKEGVEWLTKTFVTKTDFMKPIIETLKDSKMMKNDLLSQWNLGNVKKLWSQFVQS